MRATPRHATDSANPPRCGAWRAVRTALAAALVVVLMMSSRPFAQGAEPAENPAQQLADTQRQVAQKYEHLEQILLRMSELSAASDPARAALLTKAVAESRERLIGVQFASLVDQLGRDELSKALQGQEKLDADLAQLLNLLLSENRSKRLSSEKARIREYLKHLNRIINQQKSLQARTTGGAGQPKELSQQQDALGQQTGGLADKIRQNEESEAAPSTGKNDGSEETPKGPSPQEEKEAGVPSKEPSESDSSGKTPSDPSQSGKAPQPGDPSNDSPPNGKSGQKDPQDTPPGNSSQSQGQEGQPQSGQSQPPEEENAHPARQRIEAARKRMQQAREKLEKAERDGASQDQEEAIRELQQAKAELERILRQLREEEIEQALVALEARLMKMLEWQRAVYEGTTRLDKASTDGLTHEQEIEAGRLSSREADIAVEADKALLLLRDDGSSVAMPEALGQAREDMQQVVTRLARANVGDVTQSIEEDIVTALNEMLKAVRQAMEEAQQRRQNAQQGQPGMPQDPPLVDVLAELRMIRSLQLRVNNRTQRYGKLISGKHAESPELMEALIRLAERQERVYRITTDLESGRNR